MEKRFKFSEKNLYNLAFILFILAAAVYVRVSLLNFVSADYTICLSKWYDFIVNNGGFKALSKGFSDYNPPYLYLLTMITYLPIEKLYAIKLISLIFDFIAGFIIYFLAKKLTNDRIKATAASIALLFAPTVIFNGAAWAQCDIIYTSFILLSIYYFLNGKSVLSMLFYGIAFSFKLQAVLIFPFFVLLFLLKKIKFRYFLIVPAVYILSIIPCAIIGRPWRQLLTIYFNETKSFQFLTVNAPNIYQWVDNSFYSTLCKFGIALAGATVVSFTYLIYLKYKDMTKYQLMQFLLIISLVVPFLLPSMHERYFFMGDIIAIIYAIIYPRKLYITIEIWVSSFLSYSPFLFKTKVLELKYVAFLLLVLILKLILDLLKDLKLNNESNNSLLDE